MLNACQISAPKGALYTGPSLRQLASVAMPVPELQQAFEALVAVLERLQAHIRALTQGVDEEWARTDPSMAALVETLPSIGAQSAAKLLAELGDPQRFARGRAVAAYAGFVPRVSRSADRSRHGAMTKQGNPELRWITSQWSVRLLTRGVAFDLRRCLGLA
jgi:transposase